MEFAIRDPQDTPQREPMYTVAIDTSGIPDSGELVEDTVSDHFYSEFETAACNGGLTPCCVLRYSSEDLEALDEDVAATLSQEMRRRGSNVIEVVVLPRN